MTITWQSVDYALIPVQHVQYLHRIANNVQLVHKEHSH